MIVEMEQLVAQDAFPLTLNLDMPAPDDDPPPASAAAGTDNASAADEPPPGFFRCPHCRRVYGDGLYHGPAGHAPQVLCFDCWASAWGEYEQRIALGRSWRQLDAALFLICQGFTHAEAGRMLGLHYKTVENWVRGVRRRPSSLPDWLTDFQARRVGPPRVRAA